MMPYGTTADGLLEPGKTLCLNLEPAHEGAQGLGLTVAEMETITGSRPQNFDQRTKVWSYEDRRVAHPILDYLWLGPSGIARDHSFLREKGFSMILVANELRSAGQKLRSIESAADALGIEVKYVDTQPVYQQVGAFNETLQIINNHVLDWNRRNGGLSKTSRTFSEPQGPRCATVLVVCETGNDRSSMIVASYIMAMYSRSMADAVHYMLARRLSCAFDEIAKRALQTWGDVLWARRAVTSHAAPGDSFSPGESGRTMKRGFADTLEMEIDGGGTETSLRTQHGVVEDHARFSNRKAFTPFRDIA